MWKNPADIEGSHRSRSRSNFAFPLLLALCLGAAACGEDDIAEIDDKPAVRPLPSRDTGRNQGSDFARAENDMGTTDSGMTSRPDTDDGNLDDAASDGGSVPDGGNHSGDGGNTPPDLGGDMTTPPQGCARSAFLNRDIELDTAGLVPQLRARTAYDGEAVWVVYAQRATAESGRSRIVGLRINCDGQIVSPPFAISTLSDGTADWPALDTNGDTVFVTWRYSPSSGGIAAYMRAFSREGVPLTPSEVEVSAVSASTSSPLSSLVLDLDVAALNPNEAMIAGSYRVDPQNQQVFAHRVDTVGDQIGDAIALRETEGVLQQNVSISAHGTTAFLSWNELNSSAQSTVWFNTIDLNSNTTNTAMQPIPTPGGSTNVASLPSLPKVIEDPQWVVLAFDDPSQNPLRTKLRNIGVTQSLLTATAGSTSGQTDRFPSVAISSTGGVLTWARAGNPIEIWSQSFERNSTDQSITMQTAVRLAQTDDDGQPSFQFSPSITRVSDGVYFVAWADGLSFQSAKVTGRFFLP